MEKNKVRNYRDLTLSYWLILMGMVLLVFLAKNIVLYSGFNFDFENIFNLTAGSFITVGGFLVLTSFYWIGSYRLFSRLNTNRFTVLEKLAIGVSAGAMAVPFVFLLNLQGIWLPLLVSGVIYLTLMDLFLDEQRPNLTWLISWMIVLSVFVTIVLFKFHTDHDLEQRKNFAKQLFSPPSQDDIQKLTESQIIFWMASIATEQEFRAEQMPIIIQNDFDLFLHPDTKLKIQKEQLWMTSFQTNKSYYTDRINERLFFNALDHSYYFLANEEQDHFSLRLRPKTKADSEVLADLRYTRKANVPLYAVYTNDRRISSNFDAAVVKENKSVENTKSDFHHKIDRGVSSVYYKYNEYCFAIIEKTVARLIKPISLFSFTFCLFGLLILITAFLNSKTIILPESLRLTVKRQSSLRSKLQISVIGLFIVSFFIIGFVTLFYFNNLNRQYQNDLISEKTASVGNELKQNLFVSNTKEEMRSRLFQSPYSLARNHRCDIRIYDEEGTLQSMSYYGNKSTGISNQDLEYLLQPGNPMLIKSNDNSGSNYQSSFIPVSIEQELIGVMELLHPSSFNTRFNVHDFLGTLLNVYVFLFLIAGALAFAVSNSITRPITELGSKLKKLKLGKRNEVIEWKSQDELGVLIQNYNNMVLKLEQSAQLIAKTERDHAWREMAKQVAHEIKNPLTPMKLSIQYLHKAIQSNPSEAKELIDRVSSTLIEQIDNLSEIASAFSNFGKMPKAENQKIVVNETVEAIHDLFRKREDMDINLYVPIDEVYVFADKNQLIRILNNIVKNAIQAIPNDRRGKIDIYLNKNSKNAIIRISDNGEGIPAEMHNKVFRPNFTTKNSGTGLGLAMAANMIEAFNGKIYFETTVGKGTDFYIELPLMHVNDNYKNENRVLLD